MSEKNTETNDATVWGCFATVVVICAAIVVCVYIIWGG